MCKIGKGKCTYQGIARRHRVHIIYKGKVTFAISNGSRNEFWIETPSDVYIGDLGPREFMLLNELGYIPKEVINSRNQS